MNRPEKAAPADGALDYSKTLFLPKTDFPMRAGLPEARREDKLEEGFDRLDLIERWPVDLPRSEAGTVLERH